MSRRWKSFVLVGALLSGCLTGIVTSAVPVSAIAPIDKLTVPGVTTVLGMATGPDGNVWLADRTGNRIGRMTPGGAVTWFALTTMSSPFDIVAGPDGNVWFTATTPGGFGGAVGQITPAGVVTAFPIAGAQPGEIGSSPDGNLWFTAGSSVGRITVAGVSTLFPVGREVTSIAFDIGGGLWMAESNAQEIVRMTPAGVVSYVATPGHFLSGLVLGPDFVNFWGVDGDSMVRVTPAGVVTSFPAGDPTSGPTSGPENGVWFTRRIAGQITVSLMRTDGSIADFWTPGDLGAAGQPIVGPDGGIWFQTANGAFFRLRRDKVLTQISAVATPAGQSELPTALSATVTSVTGTEVPTGLLTFRKYGAILATVPLIGGVASTSALVPQFAPEPIVADFHGDATFAGSVANAAMAPATGPFDPVGALLTSNVAEESEFGDIVLSGTPVVLTALVGSDPQGPAAPAEPTGTVTFTDASASGSAPLATVPLVGGVAELTLATLPLGYHAIEANYSGDANFVAAVVDSVALIVVASPPAPRWHFETLDGAGGPNGRIDATVGSDSAVANFGGSPHVWYRDATAGNLRHGWWTGAAWAFETLDGAGGPNGRVDGDVGADISVTLFGGLPHVWYRDAAGGNLRHGWWTGVAWAFETLDGAGGPNGRVDAAVGSDSAVTLFGGLPHVWYRDATGGNLRHGWWTGSAWAFETLDGAGGPNGRVDAAVGSDISVTLFGGLPHVWYRDATGGNLRHGWWTGVAWAFETLDGAGGVNGRVDGDVGADPSVTLFAGLPHVWYHDEIGVLRHGWWTGLVWAFEDLDGLGGDAGESFADVGVGAATMTFSGTPHAWYGDQTHGDLRHAWWTGIEWRFEPLDGFAGTLGQVDSSTGSDNSVAEFGGQPHVWTVDSTNGNLRHAWYG